jgi:hypothetical protein
MPRFVSLLMPTLGRTDQLLALLPRIKYTAGTSLFELIVIADGDQKSADAVDHWRSANNAKDWLTVVAMPERQGYWKCLAHASYHVAKGDMLSNIANDVLPGRNWLKNAVEVMQKHFPNGRGVVGYNDGILFEEHTGHLLAGREILAEWYGHNQLWPAFYDHLYGDTEICRRAMEQQCYAIALRAVLFHNHFVLGLEQDDVYRFSHHKFPQDRDLFEQRKRNRWR